MQEEKLLLFIRSEDKKDKEILKQIIQYPTIQPIFNQLIQKRKQNLSIDFFRHSSIQIVEAQLIKSQAYQYTALIINKGEWKLELFKIFKELQKVCQPFEQPPDFLNSSPILLEKVEVQGKFHELVQLIPPKDILPDEEVYMW